jgi:very-short-patch-repair endonuclease
VGIDYDGDPLDPGREAWLGSRGWTMCYFTDRHIDADAAGIVATVLHTFRRVRHA